MEAKELDDPTKRYEAAALERKKHADAILLSKFPRKVVVAGPGTGKTFLFKKALEGKKKALTLTFVNTLVEDLSLELYGISEVRTLHSFARGIVGQAAKVFPKLSQVIKEDYRILCGEEINFDDFFYTLDVSNKYVQFYQERRMYYEGYFGFSDIILEAEKILESDPQKIPTYDQIVVDEFQDFNQLEVHLIDLLSRKSPILLAGDDDQALYEFKRASTEHIRQRHSKQNTDYASFSLPFCSRCTEVIVASANDVIQSAQGNGFLVGRINKPFHYFVSEEKDSESALYPQICYTHQYANKIPWFIAGEIDKIAAEIREAFSVLIICPTTTQIRTTAHALREKGFTNIHFVDRKEEREVSMLDGLRLLIEDQNCNLGWRIVLQNLLSEEEFSQFMIAAAKKKEKRIFDQVTKDIKKKVSDSLSTLRLILKGQTPPKDRIDALVELLKINAESITANFLGKEVMRDGRRVGNPALRKIPIQATTIQGSKGLASDYVFITYFDDQYFVGGQGKAMTDRDICNFLVALTRAKKKVYLVSSKPTPPAFLGWIDKKRIEFM